MVIFTFADGSYPSWKLRVLGGWGEKKAFEKICLLHNRIDHKSIRLIGSNLLVVLYDKRKDNLLAINQGWSPSSLPYRHDNILHRPRP